MEKSTEINEDIIHLDKKAEYVNKYIPKQNLFRISNVLLRNGTREEKFTATLESKTSSETKEISH